MCVPNRCVQTWDQLHGGMKTTFGVPLPPCTRQFALKRQSGDHLSCTAAVGIIADRQLPSVSVARSLRMYVNARMYVKVCARFGIVHIHTYIYIY